MPAVNCKFFCASASESTSYLVPWVSTGVQGDRVAEIGLWYVFLKNKKQSYLLTANRTRRIWCGDSERAHACCGARRARCRLCRAIDWLHSNCALRLTAFGLFSSPSLSRLTSSRSSTATASPRSTGESMLLERHTCRSEGAGHGPTISAVGLVRVRLSHGTGASAAVAGCCRVPQQQVCYMAVRLAQQTTPSRGVEDAS